MAKSKGKSSRKKGGQVEEVVQCPHLHFKTDVIDRNVLSKEQHLNLLSTPKGYQWEEYKKEGGDGGPAEDMAPSRRIACSGRRMKKAEKVYVHNFLAEVWNLLTPEMVDRLKGMLMNEFGMSPQEADDFICKQREENIVNSATVSFYKKPRDIGDGKYVYDHVVKTRNPNKGHCDKLPKFNLGIRNSWIKDFSDFLSDMMSSYVLDAMCAERTGRQQEIAQTLLNRFNTLLEQKASMSEPKTPTDKALVLVADRLATWLDSNVGVSKEAMQKLKIIEETERKKRLEEDRKKRQEELKKERERREAEKTADEQAQKLAEEQAKKLSEEEETQELSEEEQVQKLSEEEEANTLSEGEGESREVTGGLKSPVGPTAEQNVDGDAEKAEEEQPEEETDEAAAEEANLEVEEGEEENEKQEAEDEQNKADLAAMEAEEQRAEEEQKEEHEKNPAAEAENPEAEDEQMRVEQEVAREEKQAAEEAPKPEVKEGEEENQQKKREDEGGTAAAEQQNTLDEINQQEEDEKAALAAAAEDAENQEAEDEPNKADLAAAKAKEQRTEEEQKNIEEQEKAVAEAAEHEERKAEEDERKKQEEEEEMKEREKEQEAAAAAESTKGGTEETVDEKPEVMLLEQPIEPSVYFEDIPSTEPPVSDTEDLFVPIDETPAEEDEPIARAHELTPKVVGPEERGLSPEEKEQRTNEVLKSVVSIILETKVYSSPRQEALKDVMGKHLEENLGDRDKEAIDKVSSKIGTWLDKMVDQATMEYGARGSSRTPPGPEDSWAPATGRVQKPISMPEAPLAQRPKGRIYHLSGTGKDFDVNMISNTRAKVKISLARGKSPAFDNIPNPDAPMDPADFKSWYKWTSALTEVAESWAEWIKDTIKGTQQRGEEMVRDNSPERLSEWREFTASRAQSARKWQQTKKDMEKRAEMWNRKGRRVQSQ